MIFIKYIILFAIFIISVYIGYILSQKYTNRVIELKSIKQALSIFETNLKFTYETLPEIFNKIAKKEKDNNIYKIFKFSSKYMQEYCAKEAWEKSIDEISPQLNLNINDISIIKELGEMLGKTDVEGQIKEIKLIDKFLETQIAEAEEDKKKNEKLYKNLGTTIGLVIVIILI